MFRALFILLVLMSGTVAQDAVSVIGGKTYYGEIEGVKDGLLSLKCTAISEKMPIPPLAAAVLSPSTKPAVYECVPITIKIGTGAIIQIMPSEASGP